MGLLERIAALEAEVAALRSNIGGNRGDRPWDGVIINGPNGEITPSYDPKKCWVKPLAAIDSNDSSPVVLLRCRWLVPQIGLPVTVGTMHGGNEQEVLGVKADDLGLLPGYTGQDFNTASHADNHAWEYSTTYPHSQVHKDAPLKWTIRNLRDLRTVPSVAGGLKVDVGAYIDFGGYVGLDLSTHQPASGSVVFVTVYKDNVSNTVKSVAGSAVGIGSTPPKQTPNDEDYTISAYVRLTGTATAIVDADILEGRKFLESGDTIPPRVEASFADADAPTAGELTALNLRPGHLIWQGGTADFPNHAWFVDADGNATKITEYAKVPWRVEGADGADGQQTQPRTDDPVTVSDNVQHTGNVLLGGAVGDTAAEKLEVSGAVRLSKSATWHSIIKNVNSTSFPRLAIAGGNSASDNDFALLIGNAYSSISAGITPALQLNTSYDFVTESYRSNNYGLLITVDKSTGDARIFTYSGSSGAGSDIKFTRINGNVILYLDESAQAVSIGTDTVGEAKLHVHQAGASSTIPALKLVQDNDSEDFVEYEGKSVATNLTKSLVDAADVTTATVIAYKKVFIRDANGNITNQVGYEAVYSLA